MNLSEQARIIAIQLGKSENMRIAAGQMFAEAWEYIKNPDTDGAKQLSDAGLQITQKALWSMIAYNPSFPAKLGTGWRTGAKVLAIARSPDPEAAARKARDAEARANAKSNSKRASHKSPNENDGPLHNMQLNCTECDSPSVTNETGSAQAPSPRIEEIVNFLSACLENNEMQELAEMLLGLCDPLSQAIIEKLSDAVLKRMGM